MPLTIHIKLMSGEIIPCECPSQRGGAIKAATAQEKMRHAVLAHLDLDPSNYTVTFIHDDDEKCMEDAWRQHVDKWWPRRGRVPTAEDYDFAHHVEHQPEFVYLMKAEVDKHRTYEDGAVVNAIVREWNVLRVWEELDDE
jgi:hypothetical protein